VAAVLLCLWVLVVPLLAIGSEVSPALANSPHLDQDADGNDFPLDSTYLLMPAEDAEKEGPLNAELLTMLLLAASFGATVGWLLTNAQRQGALARATGRSAALKRVSRALRSSTQPV
jgi:hypothetical protein